MPKLHDHCIICGKEKTTYQQRMSARCVDCANRQRKEGAREGYLYCVDCGKPKTTYSQQLSSRCNACSGVQKRVGDGGYYTHCVDCGKEKPLGTSRRSPRCKECDYGRRRKNEYFETCQECGRPKGFSKSKLCRSCSNRKRYAETKGTRQKTRQGATQKAKQKTGQYQARERATRYPQCQVCGCDKAATTTPICKSCSLKAAWDKKGRKRTLYDTCQSCGQEKSRNDRELCLSCAGVKRMTELFGTEDKEYPMGWCDTLKERIRDRDGRKCQLCGKTEKKNGRKLDVHHIDEDKHNLAFSNLISLCARCHGKTRWEQDFYYQVFTKYRGRALKQDWQRKVVVSAERGLLVAV